MKYSYGAISGEQDNHRIRVMLPEFAKQEHSTSISNESLKHELKFPTISNCHSAATDSGESDLTRAKENAMCTFSAQPIHLLCLFVTAACGAAVNVRPFSLKRTDVSAH